MNMRTCYFIRVWKYEICNMTNTLSTQGGFTPIQHRRPRESEIVYDPIRGGAVAYNSQMLPRFHFRGDGNYGFALVVLIMSRPAG
jgi:hypothetical protein